MPAHRNSRHGIGKVTSGLKLGKESFKRGTVVPNNKIIDQLILFIICSPCILLPSLEIPSVSLEQKKQDRNDGNSKLREFLHWEGPRFLVLCGVGETTCSGMQEVCSWGSEIRVRKLN